MDAIKYVLSEEIETPQWSEDYIELLEKWRKKHDSCSIEIRWPLIEHAGVYKGSSFTNHLTLLDADPNKVYSKFKKKSVHASIVQALKSGIIIKKGEDWTALRTFYDLHCQTRQRQGTPVQPLRFFKMLHDKLLSKGYGFVLLAYKEDVPIAGGVFLCWNNVLIYKDLLGLLCIDHVNFGSLMKEVMTLSIRYS